MFRNNHIWAIGIVLVVCVGLLLTAAFWNPVPQQPPVRIGVFVYPGFAPFFIAQEKNFFAQHGVNAEVILLNDPAESLALLSSGQVDMLAGTADMDTLLAGAGADIKLVLVSDIGFGSDGIVATQEIKSVEDLRGKTIHLGVGSPSDFLFRFVTSEAGLKRSDFTIVDMPADQVGAAFAAGQIDYGVTWEPWLSAARNRSDGQVLLSTRNRPGIISDTFVVRTSVLADRRDDIVGVLNAWFDSIDLLESSPDEAIQIMARSMGLSPQDFAVQLQTVRFLSRAQNLEAFDSNTSLGLPQLVRRASEIFVEDDILSTPVNADELLDSSLLQEVG